MQRGYPRQISRRLKSGGSSILYATYKHGSPTLLFQSTIADVPV